MRCAELSADASSIAEDPQQRDDAQAYDAGQHTEQLLACDAPPTIRVQQHMKAPVFVYYELDNYFQNHRRHASQQPAVTILI